ncbi:HIT domain protein [Lodderomyces elongisporus]|uniref:HIT domain protein n=1 Tax=Lodderomyces elongisporus TaxID=36914 RepID=UPI0029253298|nr:HIT domain protein [Lodderomyces elongisporus]WLF80133.1 HIT domain protein [Lodderomyces elongisporus]
MAFPAKISRQFGYRRIFTFFTILDIYVKFCGLQKEDTHQSHTDSNDAALKDSLQTETNTSIKQDTSKSSHTTGIESESKTPLSKFDKILADEQIKNLLKEPVLQFHLVTILSIIQEGFIRNLNHEQKLEVMNLKLTDLRAGGVEENEIVEEFVQRVLDLNEQIQS